MSMEHGSFLPRRDSLNYRQAGIAFKGMLLGLAVFILVERLVVPRHILSVGADAYIPFIPLTWLIYILFFPFVVIASAYATPQRFATFVTASSMAFAIALVCFFLVPESVPRPSLEMIESVFLKQRFSRFWAVDLPGNGFPSLHVAITCLACLMLLGRRHAAPAAVAGLLICLSTLTVKQHTLADVFGGLLLACFVTWLAERRGQTETRLESE